MLNRSWVWNSVCLRETGFVVTPFLPGDSLLFATGALCATGALRTPAALGLLILAAFTGNAVNYAVGRASARASSARPIDRRSRIGCSISSTSSGRMRSSSSTAARR